MGEGRQKFGYRKELKNFYFFLIIYAHTKHYLLGEKKREKMAMKLEQKTGLSPTTGKEVSISVTAFRIFLRTKEPDFSDDWSSFMK